MYTQVKEMVNLNLFIDSHYKYIVSIIRVKHILTLHLPTANCRILPTTGCCCKNVAASPLHMLCNIFLPGRVNTTVPCIVAYFNACSWNIQFHSTLQKCYHIRYQFFNIEIQKWMDRSLVKAQKRNNRL